VVEWQARERRITQETGSVGEPVLERLGQIVQVLGRVCSGLAFPARHAMGENSESLGEDRPARRGRRHGQNTRWRKSTVERLTLDRGVAARSARESTPPAAATAATMAAAMSPR
jgi:hypothetical protein